ncbi:hypothetical protein [Streptomyces sp. NPDC088752]|uniref:hypothetical protein n=1 Tax=Streptomyces sp. NPDC088752 TaxID=3154963 RepID=UPI003415DF3A
MVRITPNVKKAATPKKTAAQKRTEAALAASAATSDQPARRGEADEPSTEELVVAATAAASAPSEEVAVPVPHQAASAPLEGVIHPPEPKDPFEYVPAPEDSDDLEHLAHASRQLRKIGSAAGERFARLERDYWVLTGRWLAEVQKKGSYKAGGHRSVEKFAKSIGIERHTYYRAIKHHVVYSALDGLITAPLAQLVVDQLYSLGKDNLELLREEFAKLSASGPVTVSAVKNLRRLHAASADAAREPREIAPRQQKPASERLREATEAGKIDLILLKEVAEADPSSARAYVNDLKRRLEEAEGLLAG